MLLIPQKVKLVCFAVLAILAAQRLSAQPKMLLHQPFKVQSRLVDSLFKTEIRNEDSAVAFLKLDEWQKMASHEGDEALELEIAFLRLKYYSSGKQINYPVYESEMHALIKRLTQGRYTHLRAKCLMELAHYYYRLAQQYDKAFDGYLEMYRVISTLTFDEFPMKQRYLYEYGRAFYYFDDLKNAAKYILEAATYSESNDPWLQFHINNTLGLIYRKMAVYDSSNLFFEKARNIGAANRDSLEIAIALGNTGHNYFLLKQYEKAIPLLEADVAYSSRYKEWSNAAAALLKLAEINFHKGNAGAAEHQCIQALYWLSISGKEKDFGCNTNAYSLLSKIYASKQNMALAYTYADSAAVSKDSLSRMMNAQILFNAKRNIEMEQHVAEIGKLQSERKMQELIRNSVIMILLLMMVITLLIYNHSKLKNRQQQFQLQQEQLLILTQKQMVEQELASATHQLNVFTGSMIEKTELIEQLQSELGEQSNEALQLLQQHTILTDEEWAHFRQLFEKAHAGYLQRLKEKLPELSQAEVRFMALAKLEFTSKQMAATLGITSDAIRMMRYRLRKKLNLSEEDSLEDLIMGV